MDQKATEDESGGVPVFDELGLQLVELSHNGLLLAAQGVELGQELLLLLCPARHGDDTIAATDPQQDPLSYEMLYICLGHNRVLCPKHA